MKYNRSLCWIRRDLRLNDHAALSEATQTSDEVAVVFIFDKNILQKLKCKDDKRLSFIHQSLVEIDEKLKKNNSKLIVLVGDPREELSKLAKSLKVEAVFTNEDYEPYAKKRDGVVKESLREEGIDFLGFKDQVIFSGGEVLKADGSPYQVFTPYKNAWLKKFKKTMLDERKVDLKKTLSASSLNDLSGLKPLASYGFDIAKLPDGTGEVAAQKALTGFQKSIDDYENDRDFPILDGTSHLSVHLRFGTLSIRQAMRVAAESRSQGAKTWQSELIWREFFSMILDRFPHVEKKAFKSQYQDIKWPGLSQHFKAWCEGKTGYPIVDAGMRQLNATGFMHNRLRMITASFLVKDLLIDWRKGEAYFAEKLLDFDLASNNGGWQWCASTGCDAQPYFRIFNPHSQQKKFDAENEFIRLWVPEVFDGQKDYPKPIVDHDVQRKRAVLLYKG